MGFGKVADSPVLTALEVFESTWLIKTERGYDGEGVATRRAKIRSDLCFKRFSLDSILRRGGEDRCREST